MAQPRPVLDDLQLTAASELEAGRSAEMEGGSERQRRHRQGADSAKKAPPLSREGIRVAESAPTAPSIHRWLGRSLLPRLCGPGRGMAGSAPPSPQR
jgi:hypothetical protein